MEKEVTISVKKNQNGTYGIFLQYCKEGVFLKSTGISLRLNDTQLDFLKRKNKFSSNVPNYEIFNERLENEVKKLNSLIGQYFKNYKKYPTKAEFEAYQKYVKPDTQNYADDLLECLSKFIALKAKTKNIKQYTTLIHHFEKFAEWKVAKKRNIKFSDLQVEFLKEFFAFLSQKNKILTSGTKNVRKGLCDNGLIKLSYELAAAIRGMKKYKIAQINDSDIIDNIQLAIEELNVKQYTNTEIVLSHHEVEILTNFKLQDDIQPHYKKNSRIDLRVSSEVLERIKYLFLLQITKGTRHSDLHKLCLANLQGNSISIKQQKTQHQYNVSVDNTTIALMKMSNSEKAITNQRYNNYLKLIFKQFFPYYKETFKRDDVGYKLDNIPIIRNYLGIEHREYKSRFELVRTHTARRTYVSVAKIKHRLTDLEIQHDIGQTNPNSLKPYKVYYEENERVKVFDLKIED